MPIYVYRAVAKNGMVVKNRVEEQSKQVLLKKIKENGLIPIDVIQTAYKRANLRQTRNKKRNLTDAQEVMQYANTSQIGSTQIKSLTARERISLFLTKTDKITDEDVAVFTQNFLLLKPRTPVSKLLRIALDRLRSSTSSLFRLIPPDSTLSSRSKSVISPDRRESSS